MSRVKATTKRYRPRRHYVLPARKQEDRQLPDTSARDYGSDHMSDEDVVYTDERFRQENTGS